MEDLRSCAEQLQISLVLLFYADLYLAKTDVLTHRCFGIPLGSESGQALTSETWPD